MKDEVWIPLKQLERFLMLVDKWQDYQDASLRLISAISNLRAQQTAATILYSNRSRIKQWRNSTSMSSISPSVTAPKTNILDEFPEMLPKLLAKYVSKLEFMYSDLQTRIMPEFASVVKSMKAVTRDVINKTPLVTNEKVHSTVGMLLPLEVASWVDGLTMINDAESAFPSCTARWKRESSVDNHLVSICRDRLELAKTLVTRYLRDSPVHIIGVSSTLSFYHFIITGMPAVNSSKAIEDFEVVGVIVGPDIHYADNRPHLNKYSTRCSATSTANKPNSMV
ncbi:hypothetical protein SeMB42_g00344 [Synchytrium endobioticum]|uniref:Uncharacterized protein n=1 Tax=Synchytrium endobioticum TaxID=286115 RepID=A0A507DSQ6_9FUNG|nr:hypothetical protein SeMB42_g00344 [Synchytrium endobioticum]